MLANLLAVVVLLGSFAFYMAAFFVPEVHRRSDFFWSGVGLFYGVMLWFCAGQITGAVLLGQIAAVALLTWLGWQTLLMRRKTTPLAQQTPIRSVFQQQIVPQRLEPFTHRRPTAPEYEFVEDGMVATIDGPSSDTAEQRPTTPAPDIRLGSLADNRTMTTATADELRRSHRDQPMVVNAAMPNQPETLLEQPDSSQPTAGQSQVNAPIQAQTHSAEAPGFMAKVGILLSWIKEVMVASTKPKPSRPIIEIPPRPPSIPKSAADLNSNETLDQPTSLLDFSRDPTPYPASLTEPVESDEENASVPEGTSSSAQAQDTSLETASQREIDQSSHQADEKAANWPEDEFCN
jgi:hypothetical protein